MTESSQRLTLDQLDRADIGETRSGNPQGFAGIVNRYTDQIFGLALRSLGDHHDAEEAVQEIFLKAYRSLDSYDSERRLYPWLYSIALNHLRSLRRRADRRHDTDTVLLAEELLSTESPNSPSRPETRLLADSARGLVQRALGELSADQRQTFILRHVRGLSTTDAATIMGVPESTLKTNLRRARRNLQRYLTSHGITSDEP